MTTDNRTNEPTAESVIAEAMVNAGAPLMHSRVEESVAAVLRANGLLSEGAPSEAQARAIRKLDNVQAILAGAQASVTDAVRELSLTSAALTAAGVAPQEPSAVTDINGHSWMTWEESGKNGTYCRSCGGWVGKVGNRQCSSAPALRSSGVDEAALAEVIARVTDLWDDPLDEVHDIPQIARAMAEWLKEQRGESRESTDAN